KSYDLRLLYLRKIFWLFLSIREPLFRFDQERRCKRDGRVGTGNNTDEECEREIFGRSRSEYKEYEEREEYGERGVDRAYKSLVERAAGSLCKRLFASPFFIYREVFAH